MSYAPCVWSQVALGDSNELLDADYEASNLPSGKHSTKGLGQTGPDPKNSVTLLVSHYTDTCHVVQQQKVIKLSKAKTKQVEENSGQGRKT